MVRACDVKHPGIAYAFVYSLVVPGALCQPATSPHRRREIGGYRPPFTFTIFMTLDFSGEYANLSKEIQQALHMLQDIANAGDGYWRTRSGTKITMNLTIENDHGSADRVYALYYNASAKPDGERPQVFLGPSDSGSSLVAVRALRDSRTHEHRRREVIMNTQATAVEEVAHQAGQYVEGVFTVNAAAKFYMNSNLNKLYMRGARTILVFHGERLWHSAICGGAFGEALAIGFTTLSDSPMSFNSSRPIYPQIFQIKALNPDVLVICDDDSNTVLAVLTFKAMQFNANAIVMPLVDPEWFAKEVGSSNAVYLQTVENWAADKDDAEFCKASAPVLDPWTFTTTTLPPWDPGNVCLVFGSSKVYADMFQERYGYLPGSWSASAVAGAIALMSAAEMMGRLAWPDAIMKQLNSMSIKTIYGLVSFNPVNGTRMGNPPGVARQFFPWRDQNGSLVRSKHNSATGCALVSVMDSASMKYPSPTWEQKDSELVPCLPGFEFMQYYDEQRSRYRNRCEPCPLGRFRNAATLQCFDCPAYMYTKTKGSDFCFPCNQGQNCSMAVLTGNASAEKFYYQLSKDGTPFFVPCVPKGACLGDNRCTGTRSGVLCDNCKRGFGRIGLYKHARCIPCKNVRGMLEDISIVLFFNIAWLIFVVKVARFTTHSLTSLHCVTVKFVISYFHISAAALLSATEWSHFLHNSSPINFNYWASLILDPLQLIRNIDCLSKGAGVKSYKLATLLGLTVLPAVLTISLLMYCVWLLFRILLARYILGPLYRRIIMMKTVGPEAANAPGSIDRAMSAVDHHDGNDDEIIYTETLNLSESDTVDGGIHYTDVPLVDLETVREDMAVEIPTSGNWILIFERIYARCMQLAIVLIFIYYPCCIRIFIVVLQCEWIDVMRLQIDKSVQCLDDDHMPWFVAASCGLLFWGIAVPCCLYLWLREHRHFSSSVERRWQFGFLFDGFKRSFYYFEIVLLVRKFLLLIVVPIPDDSLRLIGVTFIAFISISILYVYGPFDNRGIFVLHWLEAILTLCILAPILPEWFYLLERRVLKLEGYLHLYKVSLYFPFAIHALFLLKVLWVVWKSSALHHGVFVMTWFPQELNVIQKCFLSMIRSKRRRVRLDPKTYELDKSELSCLEKQFVDSLLCETLDCYMKADKKYFPNVNECATFYLNFLSAALHHAFCRVAESQQLKYELFCLQKDEAKHLGIPLWVFHYLWPRARRFRRVARQIRGSRIVNTYAFGADLRYPASKDFMATLTKEGVTLEELYVGLKFSWPSIRRGSDKYFDDKCGYGVRRRKSSSRVRSQVWNENDTIQELFNEFPDEIMHQRKCQGPDDFCHMHDLGGLEAILGMKDRAARFAEAEAASAKHDAILGEVVDLREEVEMLRRRKQACKGITCYL